VLLGSLPAGFLWAQALFGEGLLPFHPSLIFFFFEEPAHRLVTGQDMDSHSSFLPRSINRFPQIVGTISHNAGEFGSKITNIPSRVATIPEDGS